jgi:hypothetical protein
LKWILKKQKGRVSDCFRSATGEMEVSFEHSNEPSDSIKFGEFLNSHRYY